MDAYPKWVSRFEIKSGSWVFVPTDETIRTGNAVKQKIEKVWTPPYYYYHLQNGGHVSALRSHINGNCFVRQDIKSFFSSITRNRITRNLKDLIGYRDALDVACISTVRDPNSENRRLILPFGFVQSTIIASLCLYKSRLGRLLQILNRDPGITVSVYVDDIVISTKSNEVANDVLERVLDASERSRFVINQDKGEGPADKITAFNIELSKDSLVVTQQRLQKFIADYYSAASDNQKTGISGYLASINAQHLDVLE